MVDNELITKVRTRNVKSILSNVFTSTGGSSMTYPGAGIPLSTGSAWDTSITNNSSNWNTAFGWGNHASAGYLTSLSNGNGTTASGSAVNLGGELSSDVDIYSDALSYHRLRLGYYKPLSGFYLATTNGSQATIIDHTVGAYSRYYTTGSGGTDLNFRIGLTDGVSQYGWQFDANAPTSPNFRVPQDPTTQGWILKLGSDATGDIYYRNSSGYFTRLAAGTNGHVLTLAAGIPSWAAPSGGGLTVGTSTITSGTNTRVLYNNAGTLGEYTVSGSGNVAMTTSPVFTTPILGTPTSGTLTNATGYLFNNLSNPTGTTTLALSTNPLIFTSGVTTGTGATAGIQFSANSLTTGNALDFSSSSVTTGSIAKITSTSTTVNHTAGSGGLFTVASSGANSTSSKTTIGASSIITNTGTTSTNVAAYFDASGGTTNYSIQTGSSPILVNNARMFSVNTTNLFWGVGAGSLTLSGGSGIENVGIGTSAGASLTTGNRNTYVGYNAGITQSGGFNNSFFGNAAGQLTTGSANTFIGKSAGATNGSGASNTAVGSNALLNNSVGGSNTAVGVSALSANTANNNTAIGANAGLYITTGTRITAIGYNTFANSGNTAPTDAVAIGYNALFNATGVRNIGIGTETLSAATTAIDNVAIGVNAGDFFGAAGGDQNVFIGNQAAQGSSGVNSSGSNSVLIGFQTGHYNQGSNNTFIGSLVNDASAATVTGSNKITIGSNIDEQAPTTSNTLTIQNAIYGTGNSATGTTVSSGNIGIYEVAPTARLHVAASTTGAASLRLPHGTAPTSPNDGDIWTTTAGLYVRINGSTVGPLS